MASAKSLQWEHIADTPPGYLPAETRMNEGETGPSIYVSEKVIYIATEETVPVTVFNILGHSLGSDELKPGVYRLRIPAHGIYLVKAGARVIRVTL